MHGAETLVMHVLGRGRGRHALGLRIFVCEGCLATHDARRTHRRRRFEEVPTGCCCRHVHTSPHASIVFAAHACTCTLVRAAFMATVIWTWSNGFPANQHEVMCLRCSMCRQGARSGSALLNPTAWPERSFAREL